MPDLSSMLRSETQLTARFRQGSLLHRRSILVNGPGHRSTPATPSAAGPARICVADASKRTPWLWGLQLAGFDWLSGVSHLPWALNWEGVRP